MYEKYGIDMHLYFLCSYHAYNRCDGAGVESKRLAQRAVRRKQPLSIAPEYALELNQSNYQDSVAVCFHHINRSSDVFPEALESKDYKLRTKCEVKFWFYDEQGSKARETGVLLCRDLPTSPAQTTASMDR